MRCKSLMLCHGARLTTIFRTVFVVETANSEHAQIFVRANPTLALHPNSDDYLDPITPKLYSEMMI